MTHILDLSCQTSALSQLRSFLQKTLEDVALSDIQKHQVTLAVEEVCANLIIHSHQCNPNNLIHLEVKDTSEGVVFEISDQGEAFNLNEYVTPDLQKVLTEKRKGGLGIILVKKIMDEIQFESKGGTNTCRLVKWFRS
jgi:serine/threonine-protein kinase RsbW